MTGSSMDYLQSFKKASPFVKKRLMYLLLDIHNAVRGEAVYHPPTGLREFDDVLSRSRTPTDISDHLKRLFAGSVSIEPETIVELGVRGGESTYVFERVAQISQADLVSVDIDDCSDISDYQDWHFVQSDDIKFAAQFKNWCDDNGVDDDIDILFIDTSHLYEHTVDEIENWFPHLSDRAIVFFHDTNLSDYYRREDRTIGQGWDNDRGVIRALEGYFDTEFNEKKEFTTVYPPFVIRHIPHCNGLTILHKTPTVSNIQDLE
jgi:cephalosporin hydroxylase